MNEWHIQNYQTLCVPIHEFHGKDGMQKVIIHYQTDSVLGLKRQDYFTLPELNNALLLQNKGSR